MTKVSYVNFEPQKRLCRHRSKMSDDSREENVYMAKLAEQAERYDEVH